MFPLFHKKHEGFIRRMALSKGLGIFLGIIGTFFIPASALTERSGVIFYWGILLWGMTLGFVIGLAGLITQNPLWDKKWLPFKHHLWRPFWRGGIVGAWLELLFVILSYEKVIALLGFLNISWISTENIIWWAILAGFFWGAIIDLLATKFGGEGKNIL
ncbi:hypothetical protein K9L27_00350 [Candidatus Gracilibacteria bacterium]|nr:hypothetical protein [Candidatus Gracilibacteria bacterium]